MASPSMRARQRLLPRRPKGSAHADVSRLLTPDYATPPSPTASAERERRRASLPTAAYVDESGEMHDPDFRAFPLALGVPGAIGRDRPVSGGYYQQPRSASLTRGFDDDLDARSDRWRRHSADYGAHRPSWEYYGGYSSAVAPSRASTYDPPLAPLDIPDDNWTYRARESPGSGSSDERPLTRAYQFSGGSSSYGHTEEDDDATLSSMSRVVRKATGRRRLKKERMVVDLGEEDEYTYAYHEEPEPIQEPKHEHPPTKREHAPHDDDVPTCTHSLRLKYHALALRVRFGIFRAQRRINRRLHKLPATGPG